MRGTLLRQLQDWEKRARARRLNSFFEESRLFALTSECARRRTLANVSEVSLKEKFSHDLRSVGNQEHFVWGLAVETRLWARKPPFRQLFIAEYCVRESSNAIQRVRNILVQGPNPAGLAGGCSNPVRLAGGA